MTNKEFVKETVDWKFFNYLKDKATRFEDDGCEFTICIDTKIIDFFNEKHIYKYNSIGTDEFIDRFIDRLDKENVNYIYAIRAKHPGNVRSEDILNEYYELIKDKCIVKYRGDRSLRIQPKNNTTND